MADKQNTEPKNDFDYDVNEDETLDFEIPESIKALDGTNAPDDEGGDKTKAESNSEANPRPDLYDYDVVQDEDVEDDDEQDGEGKDTDFNGDGDDSDSADADDDDADDDSSADHGTQQISPELMLRAGNAGMTAAELAAFNTPAALSAAIELIERNSTQQKQTNADSGAKEEPTTKKFEPVKFDVPEDFDEDAAKVLTGLTDQFNEKLAAFNTTLAEKDKVISDLKQNFESVSSAMQQTAQQQLTEFLDREFGGLDETFHELFGTSSIAEIQDGSVQAVNRGKVYGEMISLLEAHPQMPREKAFQTAVQVAFPNHQAKAAEAKLRKKASDHRQRRSTARGSGQNHTDPKRLPKGDKRAFATAKSMLDKLLGR
jgi:hypothetical protein